MFTTSFKRNMTTIWHQNCQRDVTRFERNNERDDKQMTFSVEGVSKG